MKNRWLVTPLFFEITEPALGAIAPEGADINAADVRGRSTSDFEAMHRPIVRFTEETLRDGDRPVSLAGDCCAAIPVAAGLQHCGIDATVVWFDAHGDFNTPATSPSQFVGGMPLAMMTGRGPQWMCGISELVPLPDDRVVLVGARDLDPLERDALDASGVRQIDTDAVFDLQISGPVHVHLDTDIVDAALCPAFRYPVPGGPTPERLRAAVFHLLGTADVRAVSISGWAGDLDAGGGTARAFADVLSDLGARRPQG